MTCLFYRRNRRNPVSELVRAGNGRLQKDLWFEIVKWTCQSSAYELSDGTSLKFQTGVV